MKPDKILIISYSDLSKDPRVVRQYYAIKDNYDVDFLGYKPIEGTETTFYAINNYPSFSIIRKLYRAFLFLFRFYDRFYWDITRNNLANELKDNQYKVIIANDIMTLPLAIKLKGNTGKVYFDAHEYHPEEFNNSLIWKISSKPYIIHLCRRYIPLAEKFSTVSDPIADLYSSFLGIKPFVITNASDYFDLEPKDCTKNSKIRIIHHGAAINSRKLENMINLLEFLDERFELHLMLVPTNKKYLKKLISYKEKYSNLFFIEPVKYENIVTEINKYDIGLYILEPTNTNNKYALPNKLFEFIQARLALVVSNNISMKQLVESNYIGIVCQEYKISSIAKEINKLTNETIYKYKLRSNEIANDFSSNKNNQILLEIISNLK